MRFIKQLRKKNSRLLVNAAEIAAEQKPIRAYISSSRLMKLIFVIYIHPAAVFRKRVQESFSNA